MTMHRLSAGAGYRYLLRQVATGDCQRTGPAPVTAYYLESGNPPGRWLGRGLPGLTDPGGDRPALVAGAIVEELGMSRLFAHGLNPLTGAALGRPYRAFVSPSDRVTAQVKALPADMSPAARQAALEAITRVELGRDTAPVVAGFDLTFTVMKSVSTLWAVADDTTRQAVTDAHTAAVEQAMGFLQDRALYLRTGHGGCRQEPTQGCLAVAFDHWDSRAGDPNLHTHVVLANKVQGADGAWRSVDSRALHHAVVAVSEAYNAFLADELSRRLPVRWGWRSRGAHRSVGFELDGVSKELMAAFSQRTSQIDQAMTVAVAGFAAGHGRAPNRIEITRLRQHVTRTTRPAKTVTPLRDLLHRWRHRATDVTGMSPHDLTAAVLRHSQVRPVRAAAIPRVVVEELAGQVLAGVRERRSTWTRWNVFSEAARVTRALIAASPRDRLAVLDLVTDTVLSRCISLEAPAVLQATGRYAGREGATVFDRPDEHTFTDTVILDAETRLLNAATDTSAPTAPVFDDALTLPGTTGDRLADDQTEAVAAIAGSGRLVDLLVGPAGSGKTTTLAAVRTVWERTHGRGSVIGLAPSSTAAANLAAALGISCENTAKWLHESTGPGASTRAAVIDQLAQLRSRTSGGNLTRLRTIDTALADYHHHQTHWTLHPDQLLIVDEASLAGTLALDELTRQAARAGAKVLLVGDHAQLSAVEAGGAFGLLATRTGGARLRSLWRFTHPWEAAATTALRDGNPRILDTYQEAGRIHAGPGESMLEEAYTAWSADVAAGYATVLLAPDTATVTALNTRAHNDRVQDGLVAPGGLTTRTGTTIGVGDRIVTRLNNRHLAAPGGYVRNGDLWDVQHVHPDGSLTVAAARTRLARRGVVGTAGSQHTTPVELPAAYVADHVELAYATTTHRAQGITVDRAHVLTHAGMSRENLYVAMTRGRDTNHLYVATDTLDTDCDTLPDPHAALDAHDILTRILTTTGAEQSATAITAARQDDATSLRRLEPIARTLYADAAQARWTHKLTNLGMPTAALDGLTRSPDAGRAFVALDTLTLLAADPDAVIGGLITELDPHAEPGSALLAGARAYLNRHGEGGEVCAVPSTAGLDPAGRDLLAQVNQLLDERMQALTDTALQTHPRWLDRLGPEPQNAAAHAAWLAEITTTAAHQDRLRTATANRGAGPGSTPTMSR
ncbi:ATP-dependent RecD-like DNA helicase [Cellulomonas sp. T2.31MG-18]|uniref:MobF family relaxase n=1 Tax=Cellulomonas sp. T2.31MG-18 TaxID=3157619 RepID=UPI0035E95940